MINCEVVVSKIMIEGKEEKVYGLIFYRNNEEKPFKKVENIFKEFHMAECLKEMINKNNVSECHIDDIIDDSLV